MEKFVFLVKVGLIPSFIASNFKTSFEHLVSIVPPLEKDYLKSYAQALRDINREIAKHEFMSPTTYITISKMKLHQRRNAKE